MRERSFGIEIFLVSLAAILLEISLTRIFSFKLYYYFTYLILGIALLGLGAGGVFVALSERLRRVAPKGLVARCCLLASLAVPASYAVVLRVQHPERRREARAIEEAQNRADEPLGATAAQDAADEENLQSALG